MTFLKLFWFKIYHFVKTLFGRLRKLHVPTDPVKLADIPQVPSPGLIIRQDEKHPCEPYMDLKARFRDIGYMQAIAETMGRDFLTAMPEGAWKSRLSQISYMHGRIHRDLSETELARQIDRAQSHLDNHPEDWDDWDRTNLQEMRKACTRARYVDSDLTEQEIRLAYEGRRQHRHVLATGDWVQGREFLNKTIDTKRRIAEAVCSASGQNDLYQVLLNEFLPDTKISDVEKSFEVLRKKLGVMLPQIMEQQAAEEPPLEITDFYPAKAQMWLNQALLKVIGFDFERGGLYETGHNPVEGGTPDDTRLVIKVADTTNFLTSMKSALHEGGHGIYIQNLPRKTWQYQPVGQDLGASVHESQALLIEMIIGRTRAFFEFLSPRVEGLFHGLKNPVLSADNLYKLKTRVKPGLDRKGADEVSYFFHILLRFKLERQLVDGSLKLVDLPEAWNAEAESLLGIKPENFASGCLQDVHWFVGKFGYFPAYAIGHMMAAQQFGAIRKEHPYVLDSVRAGDMTPVTDWMRTNIHGKGRLYGVADLMKNATGETISPQPLIDHLEARYLRVA